MEYSFDEKYLQALRNRDPQVEDHLISVFGRKLRSRLRMRLRSPETVEDATQETLLRILTYFRAGKTLRRACTLPGFVNAICTNVSLEMLRAAGRDSQMPETIPHPVDSHANPEHNAFAEEQKRMVERALGHLPEKDHRLLRRVFLEEADKDQVCDEFKTNRDHLRVLLYRATARLKAVVEQNQQYVQHASRACQLAAGEEKCFVG